MEKVLFEILPTNLLVEYDQQVSKMFFRNFKKLTESELSLDTFSFYTSVSAVYSSKIEYVAASSFAVKGELQKLYADLTILLNVNLTINEVFFFASLLHLVFVKIHPFLIMLPQSLTINANQ